MKLDLNNLNLLTPHSNDYQPFFSAKAYHNGTSIVNIWAIRPYQTKMEKIDVRFADLRNRVKSIMKFVRTEYWDEGNTLSTRIEEDLGITGDDAVELMDKFAQTYKVDLKNFDFSKHFSPEGGSGNPIVIVAVAILLIGFIVKMIIALAVYPFNHALSKKIMNHCVANSMNKVFQKIEEKFWPDIERLEDVKIQDLVTSAVMGKFTTRETVRFELIK